MTGLAKLTMSIHPMASPTVCLVSIEVSSLTVTSDCSCLVIIIIILFFTGQAIGIANLQNRITFSHQTPLIHGPLSDTLQRAFWCWSGLPFWDLEPDPCFQIFLNISETNYRIFNCNMYNRRSSQELPFIFFELRALTCLWGRYDPKTEKFYTFLHISPPHPLPFKNILRQFKVLPQGYISCSGC